MLGPISMDYEAEIKGLAKPRFGWALTGSGHFFKESLEIMRELPNLDVFVSKAAAEVIRMYKKDSQGNAQFVGEDRIDHTPKHEAVRLKLGDAFDVTADKKQTAFRKLAGTSRYNYVFESAYEIVLKNAKPEAVMVTVREPMPGDWTIVSESQPHTKAASGTAEWQVRVPAESKVTLTYRVRVKY